MYHRRHSWPSFGMWITEPRSIIAVGSVALVIGCLILFGSVVIWPYLTLIAQSTSAYTGLCAAIRAIGVIASIVALVCGLAICWFDRQYSFLRVLLAVYCVEILTITLGMALNGIALASVPEAGALGSIVSFLLTGMTATMLAILPAVLIAGVVHAVHIVLAWLFTNR